MTNLPFILLLLGVVLLNVYIWWAGIILWEIGFVWKHRKVIRRWNG